MNRSSDSSLRLLDRLLGLIEGVPGSDRLLLRVLFFLVIGSLIWLAFSINSQQSALTPIRGGSMTEGIIGTPRFVNPVLALTRADQDVTALVYSGLLRIGTDGSLENDIAESIIVSDDGLTYNIQLRRDVLFHDGTPLTARDVIYTIRLTQDPDLKSPLRGNWVDVTVEEIGEYELNVILEEAYAPFIENFTLGIMPAHAWSSLPIEQLPFSQLNTEPIGSGPFMVVDAGRDTSGLIDNYTLQAFRQNRTDPRIDTLTLAFFQNEEELVQALDEREVDATAYLSSGRLSSYVGDDFQLIEKPLPRTFGIFFNQNRSAALRDDAAREALTIALNRDTLIDNALYGHGVPTAAPTAFLNPALESTNGTSTATGTPLDQARAVLERAGWEQDELGSWQKEIDDQPVTLAVTMRTSNATLFESLANDIASQWRELGVEVVTEQFEQTGLIQSVIRPRDFEALLFGLDMSRSYDLYPFWHSSQKDDPGLNIAQYTSLTVDELLERARTEQSESERGKTLEEASGIIMSENPAIFLFQPTMTYLVSDEVTIADTGRIGRPSDRFANIADWHTDSDTLWPIFRDDI